jgi:hypothetical protein
MRRSPRCLSLAVLTAVALAGCGGGSVGGGTTTPPTASAPDAKAPPTDATQPGTGPVTTQTMAPTQTHTPVPAPSPSPAGGSRNVRIPASFVAAPGGRLAPARITVPPFLAVEVSLQSADGKPHRLVLQTPTPRTLAVGAGRRAAVRIAGLRAGRYAVLLDGRRAGALVVGGDGGP